MLWLLALLMGTVVAQAAEDFLPPERAFMSRAAMVAPDRAEVVFTIASGYYVYREPFKFEVQGAQLGAITIPPGKIKFDPNFQKNVETYRQEVRIQLAIGDAKGPFTIQATVQGCADAGLCYPPLTTPLTVDPQVIQAATTGSTQAMAAASGSEASLIEGALAGGHLWRVAGVFFGLGLLLCFTPCVLPMLPILSSLIVGAGGQTSRRKGLTMAVAYSLGMATVFTGMGVAAGLAGEGFAAHLQTPWALGGFALLLVLLSLSMFDVYTLELPSRWTTRLTAHSNRLPAGQVLGVLVMGGVSALIVSPCVTAPLAAALLFISQSGNVWLGGTALFAMACGMSVPLLLLGASAGQWLPRAGTWMNGVKRLFGFIMLAVALWVAQPVLPIAAVMAVGGALMLWAGMMLKPFATKHHHRHALRDGLQRMMGLLLLIAGATQIVGAASGAQDPLRPLASLGKAATLSTQALTFQSVGSVAELDAALASAAGRVVMLDFYADWCVSCKEMERFTFHDEAVQARLKKALLLKADVTANTDAHRALLRRFKLFGPPGTLFFDVSGHEMANARVIGFQGARRFEQTLEQAGL